MSLLKSIKIMFLFTVLSLIYIHMQMNILELAYQGKINEKQITDLSEQNSLLAYRILRLKSSIYLGGNLLTEDSDLRFRDNENVIQLVTADKSIEEEKAVPANSPSNTNPLLSFLSLRSSQAEAYGTAKNKSKLIWRNRH